MLHLQVFLYSFRSWFISLEDSITPLCYAVMNFFLPSLSPKTVGIAALLGLCISDAVAQKFDIRARTNDSIVALTGKVRQGSFGAPSINRKGDIAYPVVLFGKNANATNLYAIAMRRKGKRPAQIAFQGGVTAEELPDDSRTLSNVFLYWADPPDTAVNPVEDTGYLFRITRDVAISDKRDIGFAGEMVFMMRTLRYNDQGEVESWDDRWERRSVYGVAIRKGSSYANMPVVVYPNYFDGILSAIMSINNAGSVPYNANFNLTPEESFPGFAYYGPKGGALVATTASNVIGLDYFTKFTRFSDAIIANKNRCFVVADISDDANDFDGIWQGSNPNLQPVVVRGNTAPGGGTFNTFDGKIGASRNGKVLAFVADLSGSNTNRGVFRSSLDGKERLLIAAVGQTAPGTGNLKFSDFRLAACNNKGQVAILGEVEDKDGRELEGVWLSDSNGKNLRLVILQGQPIKVGNQARQVRKFAFNPVSGINPRGQIALTITFTDKTSAVVVAEL